MMEAVFVNFDNGVEVGKLDFKVQHHRLTDSRGKLSTKGGSTSILYIGRSHNLDGSIVPNMISSRVHYKDGYNRRTGIVVCLGKYVSRYFPGYVLEGVDFPSGNGRQYVCYVRDESQDGN